MGGDWEGLCITQGPQISQKHTSNTEKHCKVYGDAIKVEGVKNIIKMANFKWLLLGHQFVSYTLLFYFFARNILKNKIGF